MRKPHLVLLQEGEDVVDHLVVVLHVGSIRIQRAISVKGDQSKAMRGGVHLADSQCT